MNTDESIRIALGDVCIEINSPDRDFIREACASYSPFVVSRQPDFRVNFYLRNRLSVPEIKQLLVESRSYFDNDRFYTMPELLECVVDWNKATLQVTTERELFAPDVDYKLMNVLMRGIYYGVYKKIRNTAPEAHLIHGCGIMGRKRCYLFAGPSGAGKTTVARLAEGRKVLNDETVLIGRDRRGFYVAGTPFDGGVPYKCSLQTHLSTIFFLRHGKEASLRKLSKSESYLRFLLQVFEKSPLFVPPGLEYLPERADLSVSIAEYVPSYELSFRPDTSFWRVIDNA